MSEQLSLFKYNNLSENGFVEKKYTKSKLLKMVRDIEIQRQSEWRLMMPYREMSALDFVIKLLDNE